MASDSGRSRDPEYPNLPAEVIAASGDDVVRAPPFEAVDLDLAALWRW